MVRGGVAKNSCKNPFDILYRRERIRFVSRAGRNERRVPNDIGYRGALVGSGRRVVDLVGNCTE
jgi:hypothetical protein